MCLEVILLRLPLSNNVPRFLLSTTIHTSSSYSLSPRRRKRECAFGPNALPWSTALPVYCSWVSISWYVKKSFMMKEVGKYGWSFILSPLETGKPATRKLFFTTARNVLSGNCQLDCMLGNVSMQYKPLLCSRRRYTVALRQHLISNNYIQLASQTHQ